MRGLLFVNLLEITNVCQIKLVASEISEEYLYLKHFAKAQKV